FGLFRYDPTRGELLRCRRGEIAAAARPIVFVHGMYGGKDSFALFLRFFAEQKDCAHRPLLIFRHPGNSSLARSGLLLSRQVKEVIGSPARATFVWHSAGGLVFRFYAEKLRGEFERAVILATPHQGSDLTRLKFLIDLLEFAGAMRFGLREGIARTVAEGRG